MEGEAQEVRNQILSARDTERKYTEAIAQLTKLQTIHRQTVDTFEKEKMAFKVERIIDKHINISNFIISPQHNSWQVLQGQQREMVHF